MAEPLIVPKKGGNPENERGGVFVGNGERPCTEEEQFGRV
jgi:hypothetical protein